MTRVLAHELRSRLDSRAVALHEEAREAGVETGTLKATREYCAVVEHDGEREAWPFWAEAFEQIADAWRGQRDTTRSGL